MTFFDDKAYTINDLITAVIAIETELGSLPAGDYASVRTRLDILEARINNPNAPAPNVNNPFYIGGSPISGVSIRDGYGDPNIAGISAVPGSLYLREDGYITQGLYLFRPDGNWYPVEIADGYDASQNVEQRTITASTYTIDSLTPDYVIFTDSTSNAINIILPVPTSGRVLVIKDKTGKAAIHSVTITHHALETIDGANNYVLDVKYSGVQLISDGINWSVCGSYNGTIV